MEGLILMDNKTKKIYNLPRAAGKTTRMMYLSEHYQVPILCTVTGKHIIKEKAAKFGIDIPEPITPQDIVGKKIKCNEIIIDEAEFVLKDLIVAITGNPVSVVAASISDEDNTNLIRRFGSGDYVDNVIKE